MFNIAYVAGGRLDPPFMPTKAQPYVKGDLIEFLVDSPGVISKDYMVEEEMEFLSVAGACNRYFPKDNWELTVNEMKIIETCYTKDLPEGIFFIAVISLVPGDVITFTFHNAEDVPKIVWFNYQFLK